ncbi:MAG: hypothetical protein AB7G17_01030 [Phycisphaerales bacterium]
MPHSLDISYPNLFIEGLKLRPTGVRVLRVLPPPLDDRHNFQQTLTTAQVAAWSGLTPHVVRARLHELRKHGLIRSAAHPTSITDAAARYGHYLTPEGYRRSIVG